MIKTSLYHDLLANDFHYVVLDEEDDLIRILLQSEEKEKIISFLKKNGWKCEKKKSGDKYLYGMERFLEFRLNSQLLIVCFQVACRSTLNGEWIPLDRKINVTALSNRIFIDSIPHLSVEDELCYLLAKDVYTEKNFSNIDQHRIEKCFGNVDIDVLMPKLEGVFFRFSDQMIKMLREKKYSFIIKSFHEFAEY